MTIPFLDRKEELQRLNKAFDSRTPSLVCLYGRRRCGKSRVLLEALKGRSFVYYSADEHAAAVQRAALAAEIARVVPGFGDVVYPRWDTLLNAWHRQAPAGSGLVMDEFPFLAASAPELPSLLQKQVDQAAGTGPHLALCGSSQRMMFSKVLSAAAPLDGRAQEIMHIRPLRPGWIADAMPELCAAEACEAWGVWGGIPRYWELAAGHPDTMSAMRELVLNPLSPLYAEPDRLLADELRDTTQASSILTLVGQGVHRLSEVAGRIERPATSLTRPISWLIELGLLSREVPFGTPRRDAKRSVYRIADQFLAFWYRFVDPNRSRIEAGHIDAVVADIRSKWDQYLGLVWEDLARASVPLLKVGDQNWDVASRWWGQGLDGTALELDIVAQRWDDPATVLVGEAKLSATQSECEALTANILRRAANCPALKGMKVVPAVWVMKLRGKNRPANVFCAEHVMAALR